MPQFGDLLIVVAVAFAAPFALGLFPGLRLPSVVLEIVAGIVIGPSVLGLVEVDQSIEVVALIGLASCSSWRGSRSSSTSCAGRLCV
jgi:Kef-type K+ transport system membrane component KefB